MLKEFRQFAMRGNVIDLAVAVIIGAAFGKIVDSLVGDVFMPLVGAITGGLNFDNYFLLLRSLTESVPTPATYEKAKELGATIGYGKFLTVTINFVIIAWILFLVVKAVNRFKAKEEAKPEAPAAPTREEILLAEIRDILKSK